MDANTEWVEVTLPFLEAVHAARERRDGGGIAEMRLLGEKAVARRRWETIEAAGLASGSFFWASGGDLGMATEIRLDARGLRAIGQWPSPGNEIDLLIALLEQREQNAADDEERGRLRQMLDALKGLGRDAGRVVVTEAMKQAMGGLS